MAPLTIHEPERHMNGRKISARGNALAFRQTLRGAITSLIDNPQPYPKALEAAGGA